ncbi:hypothetical protein FRC17_008285 [Serendipita sp. 399]|nr:hypothetical protein FRC17_008285 [Serendipita sp. 399]
MSSPRLTVPEVPSRSSNFDKSDIFSTQSIVNYEDFDVRGCDCNKHLQEPIEESKRLRSSLIGNFRVIYHDFSSAADLMTTTWSNLQLSRGRTLAELKASTPKVIYTDSNSSRCCNFWAPEMHSIGGVWYIYYTAGPNGGSDYSGQRIHVIKGSSTDLWASTWSYAGRIAFPNRDVWSIDPTVLTLNGNNYIVYSTQDSNAQCLFIAYYLLHPLTSPTTAGNAYVLSRPTYSWEQVGWNVNEGPVGVRGSYIQDLCVMELDISLGV